MKHAILAAIISLALFSCKNSKTEHTTTGSVQHIDTLNIRGNEYSVDSTSTVTWTGSKPTASHTGFLKLGSGKIFIDSLNTIVGGQFIIDMESLTDQDLSDVESKTKLEGHLKSPDFFDVKKYPTAKFVIASAKPYVGDSGAATHTISGNLTLKDITKFISFPARITHDTKTLAASAELNIDRTLWGLNYKGPGNPQDWVISKTVNIKLNIAATRK